MKLPHKRISLSMGIAQRGGGGGIKALLNVLEHFFMEVFILANGPREFGGEGVLRSMTKLLTLLNKVFFNVGFPSIIFISGQKLQRGRGWRGPAKNN